jgi:hypothetical protein
MGGTMDRASLQASIVAAVAVIGAVGALFAPLFF